MRAFIFATALALIATTAGADNMCKQDPSIKPGFMQGFCLGVVAGVAFMGRSMQLDCERGQCSPSICMSIPNGVPNGRLLGVVNKYIEAHPEEQRLPLDLLALMALQDAWPCKPPQSR
jgi:hypothetical protein